MSYNHELKSIYPQGSSGDSKRIKYEIKKSSKEQNDWNLDLLENNKDSVTFSIQMGLNVIESDTTDNILHCEIKKAGKVKTSKMSDDRISNSENQVYDSNCVSIIDSSSKDSETLGQSSKRFTPIQLQSIEIYSDNDETIRPRNSNNTTSSASGAKQILRCQNNNISNKKISRSPFSPIAIAKGNHMREMDVRNAVITTASDENFFLYRKKLPKKTTEEDVFAKLSDEIVLQIFKWLPKKTLLRCSTVCQRFNCVSQDETLWTRLDLGGRTLRSGAIGKIFARGIVILRLAQAEIKEPIFDYSTYKMSPNIRAKLQYLDLSMCIISKSALKELLSKCRNLKKLSLEHVTLDSGICNEISENVDIESLNLTMCEGLDYLGVNVIIKNLQSLKNLNISWTSLTVNSIEAITENITPGLLRLNIAGCRKSMTDNYLSILLKRCPNLIELDLSDCTTLTMEAIKSISALTKLEYLSLSRCYCIQLSSYLTLSNMESLQFLDVFGLLSDQATTVLQESLVDVGINKFMHSAVARPTVGSRRTSIWGLRTRD